METSNDLAPLYMALSKAQGDIAPVPHDAENTFHKYRYTSAEALIDEARRALSRNQLVAFCLGWESVETPVEAGSVRMAEGTLRVRYRLAHSSGAHIDQEFAVPWICERGRPRDKAEAAGLTYHLGYYLRGLLLIPRPDEAAVDQRDDSKYDPEERRGKKSEPKKAQPAKAEQKAATPEKAPDTKPAEAVDWSVRYQLAKAAFDGLELTTEERDIVDTAALQSQAGDHEAGYRKLRGLYGTLQDAGRAPKTHKPTAGPDGVVKYTVTDPPQNGNGHNNANGNGSSPVLGGHAGDVKTLRDSVLKAWGRAHKSDKAKANAVRDRIGGVDQIATCVDVRLLGDVLMALEEIQ